MVKYWPADANFKIAYPFDNQDRDGATQNYFKPLFDSFPDITRREDILLAAYDLARIVNRSSRRILGSVGRRYADWDCLALVLRY